MALAKRGQTLPCRQADITLRLNHNLATYSILKHILILAEKFFFARENKNPHLKLDAG
jgi:hypothetical protein